MPIRLIAGLGNPGPQYQDTRHNVGFWWVDRIANAKAAIFHQNNSFQGLICPLHFFEQKIWLIKPLTYMNASGRAIGALSRFYKIPPEEILIVHDELDLPIGSARIKYGGGHGGHNGIRDISTALHSASFWRLRLGIGRPGAKSEISDFVLKPPNQIEKVHIEIAIQNTLNILPLLITSQFEKAMQQLHSVNNC